MSGKKKHISSVFLHTYFRTYCTIACMYFCFEICRWNLLIEYYWNIPPLPIDHNVCFGFIHIRTGPLKLAGVLYLTVLHYHSIVCCFQLYCLLDYHCSSYCICLNETYRGTLDVLLGIIKIVWVLIDDFSKHRIMTEILYKTGKKTLQTAV